MNTIEIEQAITDLAEQPFDPVEFRYAFLKTFGNKATTIKRLRFVAYNKADLGGVLRPEIAEIDHGMAEGMVKMKFRTASVGHILRKWSVDCSPDYNLRGQEYRLWMKDHLAIRGEHIVHIMLPWVRIAASPSTTDRSRCGLPLLAWRAKRGRVVSGRPRGVLHPPKRPR
ncbi:MAG: hypothetical protein M0003_10855 [Acidithiobacillus sp.]|jgi:hypothetical protein|nr:hypothetical protein [Acidithiobacillus sp.]